MKKEQTTRSLHLGSGFKKRPKTIGIDINPKTGADVIHDLNKIPYPFKKNFFEKVYADNIIEHLDDVIRTMEEIHRICKDGALVYIATAHFSSVDSFTDPTHKHFFTSRSFDYFDPRTELFKLGYSSVRFHKVRVTLGPEHPNLIIRLILKLVNQHPLFFESRLAYLFPVGTINYILKVRKT